MTETEQKRKYSQILRTKRETCSACDRKCRTLPSGLCYSCNDEAVHSDAVNDTDSDTDGDSDE